MLVYKKTMYDRYYCIKSFCHLANFGKKRFEKFILHYLGTNIQGLETDIEVNVYWKYVVEAELTKLTYVESSNNHIPVISLLFLCISVIFLKKAMV